MKRMVNLLIFVILLSQVILGQTFSVQGVLRDPLGKTVDDGNYALTFRLYDQETDGTPVWEETQSSIAILHGIFSAELGVVVSLKNTPFDTTYYMGVSVDDGTELSPRFKLTRAPSALSVQGTNNVFPSNGNVGVGTRNPDAGLHIITNEAADDLLKIESSGTDGNIVVNADGKMIVTQDSLLSDALDIYGNLSIKTGHVIKFSDGTQIASADFGGSATSVVSPGDAGVTADANSAGTGDIQFAIGSSNKMTIANNGAVRIGDGTPQSATEAGDLYLTGDLETNDIAISKLYDVDNTDYSIDPDQHSYLNWTSIAGYIDVNGYGRFYGNLSTRSIDYAGSSGEVYVQGDLEVDGNAYIPILYDSDDTYYYVDPSETGRSARFAGSVYATELVDKVDNDTWYADPSSGSKFLKLSLGGTHTAYMTLDVRNRNSCFWDGSAQVDWVDGEGDVYVENTLEVDGNIYYKSPDASRTIIFTSSQPEDISSEQPTIRPSYQCSGVLGTDSYWWWRIYTLDIKRTYEYSLSDESVKKNIKSTGNSLDKVMKLRGVSYDVNTDTHPAYKNGDMAKSEMVPPRQLGFVAQELQEIIPEMVVKDKDSGLLMICNYEQMFPVVVGAIQELKGDNDELRAQNERLEQRLVKLEAMVARLAKEE